MPALPVVSAASALLNPWDDHSLDAVIKMAPWDMIFGFAKRDENAVGEMLLVRWRVHRCFGGLLVIDDQWRPAKQNPAIQRKIPSFKQLTEFPHEIKLKVMSNTIKVGWFPDPD